MKAPARQRKLVPAKTHKARCYCVCDLGTQQIEYKKGYPEDVPQIMINWELPECRAEFDDNGQTVSKPQYMSLTCRFSTFKKSTLGIILASWIGKCDDNFDFGSLLMEPCALTVIHEVGKDGVTRDKIGSVAQLMDGVIVPDLENDVIYYSIQEHGKALPQAITGNERLKWLADKIAESNEWKAMDKAKEMLGGPTKAADIPLPEDTTDYGQQDNTIHDDIPF